MSDQTQMAKSILGQVRSMDLEMILCRILILRIYILENLYCGKVKEWDFVPFPLLDLRSGRNQEGSDSRTDEPGHPSMDQTPMEKKLQIDKTFGGEILV